MKVTSKIYMHSLFHRQRLHFSIKRFFCGKEDVPLFLFSCSLLLCWSGLQKLFVLNIIFWKHPMLSWWIWYVAGFCNGIMCRPLLTQELYWIHLQTTPNRCRWMQYDCELSHHQRLRNSANQFLLWLHIYSK